MEEFDILLCQHRLKVFNHDCVYLFIFGYTKAETGLKNRSTDNERNSQLLTEKLVVLIRLQVRGLFHTIVFETAVGNESLVFEALEVCRISQKLYC